MLDGESLNVSFRDFFFYNGITMCSLTRAKKTYWLEICNLDEVLDDNIQLDI